MDAMELAHAKALADSPSCAFLPSVKTGNSNVSVVMKTIAF
jgi:hypothetical protein